MFILRVVLTGLAVAAAWPLRGGDAAPLPAAGEAEARARLLHAVVEGALRVMHRDFFRRNETRAIPSESLRDVFRALADDHGVQLRWLASPETIMNEDHKARDAFDTAALRALAGGAASHREVREGRLRWAGPIVLRNECLKCHVSGRSSLEDRHAALVIEMPVRPAPDKP